MTAAGRSSCRSRPADACGVGGGCLVSDVTGGDTAADATERRRLPVRSAHDDGDPLRVVIVDDEAWRGPWCASISRAHPDVEIVAECANGFEAVKAVSELAPDVMLLDVQMPKLDGFEVLELLGRDVPVIFMTAYDEFALRAFEVHAVDYLLKPFSEERLAEALSRARARLRRARRARRRPTPALDALTTAARPRQGRSSAW